MRGVVVSIAALMASAESSIRSSTTSNSGWSRQRRRPARPHLVLPPFPSKRYDIAYVDPPWYYYGSPIKDAAAGKHYPLMSLDELAAIDLRRILNPRAAVFLWATCPRLHFAVQLIEAWGLHYRGVAYVGN